MGSSNRWLALIGAASIVSVVAAGYGASVAGAPAGPVASVTADDSQRRLLTEYAQALHAFFRVDRDESEIRAFHAAWLPAFESEAANHTDGDLNPTFRKTFLSLACGLEDWRPALAIVEQGILTEDDWREQIQLRAERVSVYKKIAR